MFVQIRVRVVCGAAASRAGCRLASTSVAELVTWQLQAG